MDDLAAYGFIAIFAMIVAAIMVAFFWKADK